MQFLKYALAIAFVGSQVSQISAAPVVDNSVVERSQALQSNDIELLVRALIEDSFDFEQPERRLGAAAGRTGAKVATNIYRQGGYLDKLGKNLDKVSDLGKLWGQGQAQYLASNKQALLEKRLGAANIYKSGRLMNTLGKNLDKVADLGKLWGQGQAHYLAGNKKEALIN